MIKTDLISITGERLKCAPTCVWGYQCFGGYANERKECDEGITSMQQALLDNGFKSMLLTQQSFRLRVFDFSSPIKPVPSVGDIFIEKGGLRLG